MSNTVRNALSKVPRQLPSRKLLPIPVTRCPWSHLGVDFITDLSASDRYTYFQLPWKPQRPCLIRFFFFFWSARRHCFRPWSTINLTCVEGFFSPFLGVIVSLTSSYHLRSNGQTDRKIQEISHFLRTFFQGHKGS